MTRILIVEDEESLRSMYKKLLSDEGYAVDVATNGIEGLEEAFENRPDLILLDISMPQVDGMTVMKKIREDEWGKDVKIIILTNLEANDERIEDVLAHYPSYYLLKVNTLPEQVVEKVKEVLSEEPLP